MVITLFLVGGTRRFVLLDFKEGRQGADNASDEAAKVEESDEAAE